MVVAVVLAGVAERLAGECNLKRTYRFSSDMDVCYEEGAYCVLLEYTPMCERCRAINISIETHCTEDEAYPAVWQLVSGTCMLVPGIGYRCWGENNVGDPHPGDCYRTTTTDCQG